MTKPNQSNLPSEKKKQLKIRTLNELINELDCLILKSVLKKNDSSKAYDDFMKKRLLDADELGRWIANNKITCFAANGDEIHMIGPDELLAVLDGEGEKP